MNSNHTCMCACVRARICMHPCERLCKCVRVRTYRSVVCMLYVWIHACCMHVCIHMQYSASQQACGGRTQSASVCLCTCVRTCVRMYACLRTHSIHMHSDSATYQLDINNTRVLQVCIHVCICVGSTEMSLMISSRQP